MIHGLIEEEKFKLLRPIFADHSLDGNNMPIMHKVEQENLNIQNMQIIGVQNLTTKTDNSNKLALTFRYDKNINKYWNDPFKYIPLLKTAMAVGTPDYSVYPNMNPIEIEHNIYKNRWLGCLWQTYGITALPTVAWWGKDTYDVCFSGIEKGTVVIISTIGSEKNKDVFIRGFEEMKRRILPSLIIVYGNMFDDMRGRFINVKYEDAFANTNNSNTYQQIRLFSNPIIFERK